MKQISPSYFSHFDKLQFDLTFTMRNEVIDKKSLGSNYVIDTDGVIYEISKVNNGSATIKVVGGMSTFINGKMPSPQEFYLSTNQKRTLSNIMRWISSNSKADISSSNSPTLDKLLNNQYNNFRG